MKKYALIAALLAAAMTFTACGGNESTSSGNSASAPASDKSISERTAELLAAVEFPEMAEVPADNLMVYYKLDQADITEFSAYVAGAGVYPDEFGIFVAKDAETAATVKERLEERVEKQRNTYADYSPDEMYKFDDYFVTVNGNTVSFAVCGDNAAAREIIG